MKGRIHSIETLGTVDGPGVRFVLFMQGCPMRCLYCHNPDTWDTGGGTIVDTDEILQKYEGCRNFLKNGGLTVTGGEPLLQIEFVTELFMKAKQRGIHTCLDTSGIVFNKDRTEDFDNLIKYTDLVLLDIKHIDTDAHKNLTGHANTNVLNFAKYLDANNIPMWIRHVVVRGITLDRDMLIKLGEFIGGLKNVQALEVLPYHDMGKFKYEVLKIPYPLDKTPVTTAKEAAEARKLIVEGIKNVRK